MANQRHGKCANGYFGCKESATSKLQVPDGVYAQHQHQRTSSPLHLPLPWRPGRLVLAEAQRDVTIVMAQWLSLGVGNDMDLQGKLTTIFAAAGAGLVFSRAVHAAVAPGQGRRTRDPTLWRHSCYSCRSSSSPIYVLPVNCVYLPSHTLAPWHSAQWV